MNEMRDFTAGKALRSMASAMGHKWADADGLAAYLRALSDLDPADIERACEDWIRTDQFWPRPAALRERVEVLKRRRVTSEAPAWVMPEMWTDPTTGQVTRLFACRECQDTGWVQAGPPQRPGIDAETLARYTSVRRCECKRRQG